MGVAAGRAHRIEGDRKSLPADSIVQLIEQHARLTPGRVALEHDGRTVSYGDLLAHAHAVARTLSERGVEPGETVAIWAHRRPAVVAAMLGALEARAAYTPIDPSYPDDRIEAVLRTARPVALLYDSGGDPPSSYADVVAVDVARTSLPTGAGSLSFPRGGDAAYIVFTSGSTGSPKGVVVEHRSLLNYVCWCAAVVGMDGRGAPLFASLGFDHAMTCLWVPLIQGKSVSLSELWQAERIFGSHADRRYTFLKLTPSHGRFFERMLRPDYGDTTGVVMFGGEALSWQLLNQIGERLARTRVVNHYGPSEATVGCCWHELKSTARSDTATVPIGKPIWNSQAYVVDDDLRPVAAGQEGELVMGGLCLARGYLGDDDENRAFIPGEAVASDEVGKLYRTGDFVRQLDEGALLYLGRHDSQVKIRGHRLELGELRVHVTAIPAVADVAFDVIHDEMDHIELFVVPAEDAHDAHDELVRSLRTALGKALPQHLIPERVHIVNQLVFNAHGKCDLASTRQLAELEGVSV